MLHYWGSMLTAKQYKKIQFLYGKEHSIREINKTTGHSRNTIKKVLKNKTPQTFNTPIRPSKLDKYKSYIEGQYSAGVLSTEQIFNSLIEEGYDGSFSLLRRFLSRLTLAKKIDSKKRKRKNRKKHEQHVKWIMDLLQGRISCFDLKQEFSGKIDSESIENLYQQIIEKPLRYRNRAIVVLADCKNIPQRRISEILRIQRNTVRQYLRKFKIGGYENLFDFRRKKTKKFEDQKFKKEIFKILHTPPSNYEINRTTWRIEDIYNIMAKEGLPISKPYIRIVIKKAGYRFIKAKKVLTSTDPLYLEKLKLITDILSNLKPSESFFSIDEFGPFSIKLYGGRSWTAAGENKIIHQFQKSKGSLILTAALELSTNQVTHFYSSNKNTDEMIKLLNILLDQYKKQEKIYLSWDAASWHASKKLYEKVDELNEELFRCSHKTPVVELAPLPACAQFLNVIESVFSGMAKAIIHNSNYNSVEECMKAIDRYFQERNRNFKENPKRAGNKIWGKEITKATFSESNNCKDPVYMRC
jgi:transposase